MAGIAAAPPNKAGATRLFASFVLPRPFKAERMSVLISRESLGFQAKTRWKIVVADAAFKLCFAEPCSEGHRVKLHRIWQHAWFGSRGWE
ncbi:hypothetical protein [Rhizobium sp. A37_96]